MAKNFYGRGGMGGMNMQQAIKQAQKMQEDMQKMQEQLKQSSFEASAGGGMVTAHVNGSHQVLSVEIKPEAVDPDDVEMLQDLVLAAVNEALHQAEQTSQDEMSKVTGGMPSVPGLF